MCTTIFVEPFRLLRGRIVYEDIRMDCELSIFLIVGQDCLAFKGCSKMLFFLCLFFGLLLPILKSFHIAEGFHVAAMA